MCTASSIAGTRDTEPVLLAIIGRVAVHYSCTKKTLLILRCLLFMSLLRQCEWNGMKRKENNSKIHKNHFMCFFSTLKQIFQSFIQIKVFYMPNSERTTWRNTHF